MHHPYLSSLAQRKEERWRTPNSLVYPCGEEMYSEANTGVNPVVTVENINVPHPLVFDVDADPLATTSPSEPPSQGQTSSNKKKGKAPVNASASTSKRRQGAGPSDASASTSQSRRAPDVTREQVEEEQRLVADLRTYIRENKMPCWPIVPHLRMPEDECTLDRAHDGGFARTLKQDPALAKLVSQGARAIKFDHSRMGAPQGVALMNLLKDSWGLRDPFVKPWDHDETKLSAIRLYINWPGYKDYFDIIPIHYPWLGDISKLQLAIMIAVSYHLFFKEVERTPMQMRDGTPPRGFTIGARRVMFEHLRLLQIVEVDAEDHVWSADINVMFKPDGDPLGEI